MSENTSRIRPLVAGNWKMNGLRASLAEALAVRDALPRPGRRGGRHDLPAGDSGDGHGRGAAAARPSRSAPRIATRRRSGANTGDISAEMVADAGAPGGDCRPFGAPRRPRRARPHGAPAKPSAAHRAGLTAIVCIGETAGRASVPGSTLEVVRRQLTGSLPDRATAANTVVAYEPVWAIGTGLTPTLADVAEVHGAIRAALAERFGAEGSAMRILYGGSVKPAERSRAACPSPT